MKRILVGLMLATMAMLAWALPTVSEVQEQVKQGHYEQAQTMMKEVVAAKPGSAKAHYLYAELLAHNGQFAEALTEAQQARTLDPKIGFTDPTKFNAFEHLLQNEARNRQQAQQRTSSGGAAMVPMAPVREERSSGLPGWVWGAGFAVLAVVLYRRFANRRPAVGPMGGMPMAAAGQAPYGGAGYGAAPGYGPGYGAPMGGGSGMLGTGIAAAGGFAAGMLADRLMHPGSNTDAGQHHSNLSDNTGGLAPGMFDNDADADALRSRDIDFGSGNDWDSGGGGGLDSGGSSSDDSW
jgi:hypothetical protein